MMKRITMKSWLARIIKDLLIAQISYLILINIALDLPMKNNV